MASNRTPCTDQEDLISLAEVETWDTEALKDYCRRRGYKVSGSRKELTSRVYFLYNNDIHEEPGAKEQEASRRKDYQILVNVKYPATDPNKLKRWIDEKQGMKHWPPISFMDIHWFLKSHGSAGLSREDLTAYKEGKAFSYFSCDWLKEVYFSPINPNHSCCYLKAACTPSQRINDEPHNLWIKVVKDSGEIVSAFCSCVAG